MALDVETYDPGLKKRGPGWGRGEGHIVGVSIAVDNHPGWYFPMRHKIDQSGNMSPSKVLLWLKDVLSTNIPKVGANLIYDLGWLEEEGVKVKGDLYDVQYAEALLTENAPVNLDHLGKKYLKKGKGSDLLYHWLSEYYGGTPTSKQRANIHRAPPALVGPYAIDDVELPLQIIKKQATELKKQDLWNLFKRENKLIRILIAMRQRGVRVDVDKAEQLYEQLSVTAEKEQANINWIAKTEVNINASKNLATVFDSIGIEYQHTAHNNPSFTKEFLIGCPHPIADRIIELRKLNKLKNDFIKSAILEHNINGRIHCQFHPLRSDDGGARSGRFSSSDPNLQQIPSRDDLAPLIRGLFVPDDGHKQWRKQDASQIEYRNLAHFAVGEGSDEVRRTYCGDASTDYHSLTQQLVKKQTGIELQRKPIKNINFGLIYGMGEARLSSNLGLSKKEGRELFEAYHRGAPFAMATMNYFSSMAQDIGYVKTILGRRSRFELYEPFGWRGDNKDRPTALPHEKALRAYGPNIQRAKTHKALNRVLQGSAADALKETMLQCDEQGVFDVTGVPLLTVHDELDFSDPGNKDQAFAEIKRISEQAIKLRVPVIIDEEVGPDWGHVKEIR